MLDQEDLEQEFGLNEEVDSNTENEVVEEVKQEAKEAPVKLHISQEDWIAQGRDPELWVPPEVFKERTQRINETSKLKQENARLRAEREEDNRRLTNVAFLQQQQITRLRSELDQKRDDAIEIGDKAAVKAYDKQLRDLDTEESLIKDAPKQTPNIPPEVSEWNAENSWLTPDHPLQPVANDVFVKAINEGKTIAGALRLVDKELAKRRQDEPTQRNKPTKSIVDSPRGAVSRSESVTLKMSDCTREEREMFNEFYKPSGITEKEFLKSVADSRKVIDYDR
jgi:hypothetical protein